MVNVSANFEYTANFGPVMGQMEMLARQANVLNNTMQNLDKQAIGLKTHLATAFASDIGKIGGWNAKMVELTDSVDNFGQALLKQKLTLRQYAQEAIGSFSQASNAHKLAVREVAREMSNLITLGKDMNGKQMGMMITPATIDLKDFNTQMAVSRKQWAIFNSLVQDGTTHLINFGKNTQWAGRQITVGLTVPLTIYGNTVSKIFREVDAELTRFQKVYGGDLMNSTADATKQMVDDVRQLAIEFSKSMGIAAKDTAALAADLAATGLEGQKLLASIRETTRLAVLGDVSNQDAMKTTLSLQNAFKMNTDELAKSVNFLNAVENQTSLSLQDLTTAIPKAGPVIKALGGDVKDLSVLMVALKEGGISAAEGANAIKSGMASLINPTKKATEVAKQYGIDINNVVQANRGQLMPTIMEFQKQLSTLDEFGKAQVIENVFGKYQFARMAALFDNLSANASQTNQVLALMGKSNKDLAATAYQEMDTLMNSANKRFQRAVEGIKAEFISIGGSITSAVTPILESLTGKIQKAVEFFNNLPKPIKSFIKVATGLTAIAGPIIMMVGIFANFMGYVSKGAMGIVNLGRRMAGVPVEKFEMLTDTQLMAQKATQQLANSFDMERASVERLNQALGIYKQNLVDAVSLNTAFLNRQVAPLTTSGTPPKPTFQRGGSSAWVPGSGDGDKVPAMLEPGEYVVNKKAAAQYAGTLDQINFQSAPRFQGGGRISGYADKSYSPEDLQMALRAWIMPMLSGLAPFNNPTKSVVRPAGEKYPGFFADIFNQEGRKGIGSQELMRAETFHKKGEAGRYSTGNASVFAQAAMHGRQMPKFAGGVDPFLELFRFTSFSDMLDTAALKDNYMSVFKTQGKQQRSIDANKRKLLSEEIIPYFIHMITSNAQGIDVNKLFTGESRYGNEGEFILNPRQKFPVTGLGMDIATRLPIIHSIQSGSTRMINGRPVQVAQMGGRIQSHQDTSMPPAFAEKQKAIEGYLAATHAEATTGRFAGMPTTEVGSRTSGMGGFSSLIPGANGVYEIGGKKYVIKSHSSAESALIEQRGTQLTRDIFGLETPIQEFIKFAHPNTGQTMFGVRSPFDAKFANPTGQIGPQDFFMQALSAIIRGDGDLQPDNLFGNIVGDVGAAYVSDRAAQPRGLTGKRADIATQAKVNFLMMKGGAKKWFAESTAGLAASMSPDEYESGFQNAISQALAKAPAAIAGLGNLTPEEQAMYSVIVSDLEAARGLDWRGIHAHHSGISPTIKKPSTPTANALAKKAAEKAELNQAVAAGFPEWMLAGRVSQSGFNLPSAAGGMGEQGKKLVTTLARMNPPHAGHGILLDQAHAFAQSTGSDFRFSLSSKEGDAKNPFSIAEKYDLFRMMFPQYAGFLEPNDTTSISGKIKEWAAQGYSQVDLFLGADQVPKFDRFFPMSARKAGMKGVVHEVSRPEGALSATALRAAIAQGDPKGLLPFLPAGLPPKQQQAIIKKLLGKKTQLLESHMAESKVWDPNEIFGSSPGENRLLNELGQGSYDPTLKAKVINAIKSSRFGPKKEKEMLRAVRQNLNPSDLDSQRALATILERMLVGGQFAGLPDLMMGHIIASIVAPMNRQSSSMMLSEADPTLQTVIGGHSAPAKFKRARDVSYFKSMGVTGGKGQKLAWARGLAESAVKKYKLSKSLIPDIMFSLGVNKQSGAGLVGEAAHAFQSGGRLQSHQTETTTWAKKAAAPKAYTGVLQGIPDWASKGAERAAVQQALKDAGVSDSDNLARIYMKDVLAHINPSTTNTGDVYEKVWEAANLMKDSAYLNIFLETIRSRKDIPNLTDPNVIARVAAESGMSQGAALAELTKINSGIHPTTAQGARAMLSLARIFPSGIKSPHNHAAVAAGLAARLSGNFYGTLGSRALPANLPTVTVRAVKDGSANATSRSNAPAGLSNIMFPSGAIRPRIAMPNIQSLPSAAGGTGSRATVKVDAMGNVLSNGIDDMVAKTVTGQSIAVSSKELLAVGTGGLIAGVTSPGDEARGNIVHPVGTALMRGKKLQDMRLSGFATTSYGPTPPPAPTNKEPVYDQPINTANVGMSRFAASMFGMVGIVQQLGFALQQFTSETQNGTSKLVAGGELLTTGLSYLGQNAGDKLLAKGQSMKASGGLRGGLGTTLSGIGKAANFLGNPLAQIGLQVGILAINKSIEFYNNQMEKARIAGNAAFKEPTESAKLLGVQLKSATASAETYAKYASKAFGSQGRGTYDETFAKTVNADYGDMINSLKEMKNQQQQVNQLMNVYANLIQRGMDVNNAREMTAEIARQGKAIGAYNIAQKDLTAKTSGEAMKMQTDTLKNQIQFQKELEANAKNPTNGSWWTQKTNENVSLLSRRKMDTQLAAQIGATIKSAYAISASDPIAADEALSVIVSNFKNADWDKVKGEIASIAGDQGFGELSNIARYIKVDEGLKTLGDKDKQIFLTALKDGLGPELEKMLGDGQLSVQEKTKLKQMALEAEAVLQIKAKIDLGEQANINNLGKLKEAIQAEFQVAVDAKQAELTAEDKRHEKAMKNLDNESEAISKKKDLLQRNTDYYLKELQRESQAEDYYAKQRETALGGLSAISQGDVFGFIGAQMQAATQSDQFGRQRSMDAIQETADAEQRKLDDALKGIDARRKAEDERHNKEVQNINDEIARIQKKNSTTSALIDAAIKSAQAVIDASPGTTPADQKAYAALVAQANADKIAATNAVGDISAYLPKSVTKEAQATIDKATADANAAITAMQTNVDDATKYIDTKTGEITDKAKTMFEDIAKVMDISKDTQPYVDALNSVNNALKGMRIDPATGYITAGTGGTRTTVRGDAAGGYISGPGSSTSDSIPARLSNGEFVVRASAVKQYGTGMLNSINQQRFSVGGYAQPPGFAGGGQVGMPRVAAPSAPKYSVPTAANVPTAAIAHMASGGMAASNSDNSSTNHFHFNGAGMDMVMHHVNKQIGGRINNNSRSVG